MRWTERRRVPCGSDSKVADQETGPEGDLGRPMGERLAAARAEEDLRSELAREKARSAALEREL